MRQTCLNRQLLVKPTGLRSKVATPLYIDDDLNTQQIEEAGKRRVGTAKEGEVRVVACRPN